MDLSKSHREALSHPPEPFWPALVAYLEGREAEILHSLRSPACQPPELDCLRGELALLDRLRKLPDESFKVLKRHG